MLRDSGFGEEIAFDELNFGESIIELNKKGVPTYLISILELTRTKLQEIQSEIQFSGNNYEKLVLAVTKKIETILTLPIITGNILYRMNNQKIKTIISKVIANYAEKAEQIEMIGTLEERTDFFVDNNGFGFEIDKLIAILKDK